VFVEFFCAQLEYTNGMKMMETSDLFIRLYEGSSEYSTRGWEEVKQDGLQVGVDSSSSGI
jgi:hypothetical protein